MSDYDVNITNLFYQQTQISQTIANLLEIIRQSTANRKKAQDDVDLYTNNLDKVVQTQQATSLSINQKEADIKNIQSAISGAGAQLDDLNSKLGKINSQINAAKSNGLGLTQQLSIALNKQTSVQKQIDLTNNNIDSINKNINSQSQSCAAANQVITGLKANISSLQGSIAGINERVAGIDGQIDGYTKQIAALQAQINALNDKIAVAGTEKQNLINLNYTVPQQIANLNAQISIQQASCSQTIYGPADLKNAQNQLLSLQKDLGDAGNQVDNINANITAVKAQLTDLLSQSGQLSQQIGKVQADLGTLKQRLPQEQNSLSELYVTGNQQIQIVRSTNSSLQAAIARFQQESNALAVANLNLQKARTDQQNISQSINLILQQNTAGLPFPSAPADSGLLGGIGAINSVDSINAYLLRAYGAGLNFNLLSSFFDLRMLYNFGGNSIRSNCPDAIVSSASAPSSSSGSSGYSGLGKVKSVQSGNTVVVSTDQGEQTINLDSCSLKLANIPNYNLNVGDVLVWKGKSNNGNSAEWYANQITCFH